WWVLTNPGVTRQPRPSTTRAPSYAGAGLAPTATIRLPATTTWPSASSRRSRSRVTTWAPSMTRVGTRGGLVLKGAALLRSSPSAEAGYAVPGAARVRGVVADHGGLDQAVGPVGREEDLARVVEPERREVAEEVVLVGRG